MQKSRPRTVIGIPASYDENEDLELKSTKKYLRFLDKNQADTVMTTAGTSHFNLLSNSEIHLLNEGVVNSFSGNKIIGVPALSTKHGISFIERANSYIDSKTNLMLLYPDRFYSNREIIEHMKALASTTENPIYIHGKVIRNSVGGQWEYAAEVINELFSLKMLKGIKEEHSDLNKSYNFVSSLNSEVDVIVAGGSMRRFEFLRSAGANSFLSGVGNLFPKIEQLYLDGDRDYSLSIEKRMFKVFMKFGWHKSLRIALAYLDLTCYHARSPWPLTTESEKQQIIKIIKEIKNEQ